MTDVHVAGRGLAALTCARLLARQGHDVLVHGTEPPGPRWLVLPTAAARLLCEIWELDAGLLAPGWLLTRRQVRWGPDARAETVDAPAVLVDGAELNQRLADNLPREVSLADSDPESTPARWTVTATPPGAGEPHQVGRRQVITAAAQLRSGVETSTTYLHTTPEAWIHLAPVNAHRALVQVMVPGPVSDSSRLLGEQLASTGLSEQLAGLPEAAAVVAAAPRLHLPPCGPGWLAVGTAALRYDPLSGSGTAQAVRTAILTAAVIDAIERGLPEDEVGEYYRARLRAAFRDHLRSCLRLYRAAFPGSAWQDEIDATTLALRTSTPPGPLPYALVGLRLKRADHHFAHR